MFGLNEAGRIRRTFQTAEDFEAEMVGRHERQLRGFYTLSEVAQTLAEAHGLDPEAILKQMKVAYYNGELIVRDDRTHAPHLPNAKLYVSCGWVFPNDVDTLLARWGVGYCFPRLKPGPPEAIDPPPKAIQRQHAQEAAILAKLAELGIDPQAVPSALAGKPSAAKQAVREGLDYSDNVMNKAWQRLRDAGSLKDA